MTPALTALIVLILSSTYTLAAVASFYAMLWMRENVIEKRRLNYLSRPHLMAVGWPLFLPSMVVVTIGFVVYRWSVKPWRDM